MSDELRTIRLYGKLSKFGRIHRLAVDSAAEAVRALCVLLPGFERELMTAGDRGMEYAVLMGRQSIGEHELQMPAGDRDIRIAPIIRGAKRAGLVQTIAGVVLIAAGVVVGIYGSAIGIGPVVAQGMIAAGIGMVVGGVLQMISPMQRAMASKDPVENGASYNMNGPVNTVAQGNPVPILYGRCLIGCSIISGSVVAEDLA